MVSSALVLILVFALIGTLQFFTEPQILRPISNGSITPDFTPNIYAFNLAFSYAQFNYASAISFSLGFVVFIARVRLPVRHPQARERLMTATTPAQAPATTRAGSTAPARRSAAGRGPRQRVLLPHLFLAILVLYFLIPLWWLVVASTKNAQGLFGGARGALVRLALQPARTCTSSFTYNDGDLPALARQLGALRAGRRRRRHACSPCWPATASRSSTSPGAA